MIELRNIQVTFNAGTPLEHRIFHKFCLRIEAGSFVTLIGGNGAGKSTLMNVLSGDLIPEKGHVFIDGKDVTRTTAEQRSAWVSRVFQDPILGSCPSLTLEENLALAFLRGQRRGLSFCVNPERRVVFRSLLASLGIGLEKRLKDPIGSLSGGQRQAVSLLMATLLPAKILLLDEHTAALDPKMAEKILDLTQKVVMDREITVLMITHSMQQALRFGNRTLLLSHGNIERDFSGPARANLSTDALATLFVV
ncbi:MAG: ABC transporter ATP-binding protein [Verrucomicrobia bacterium GWF2_51_19]|nr:MAG: ABC transporter ATP-binding protein [Verrucomicrobia bacterium GWF2_51_19]HCJ11520.1 ABC transporter ATP-binding protein [Opitutae bacterium]